MKTVEFTHVFADLAEFRPNHTFRCEAITHTSNAEGQCRRRATVMVNSGTYCHEHFNFDDWWPAGHCAAAACQKRPADQSRFCFAHSTNWIASGWCAEACDAEAVRHRHCMACSWPVFEDDPNACEACRADDMRRPLSRLSLEDGYLVVVHSRVVDAAATSQSSSVAATTARSVKASHPFLFADWRAWRRATEVKSVNGPTYGVELLEQILGLRRLAGIK